MTIRLLTRWNDLDANTITTQDAATEAGLIAANMATSDLTGGVRRYRAAGGPSSAPVDAGQQPASIAGSEQQQISVPPRCRLFISGGAGADGTAELMRIGSDQVEQSIKIVAGPNVFGPFADERRIRVSSNTGRFDMSAERVMPDRQLGSSVMFIGSSTFAAGSALPNLPADVGVQSVSPDLTALNASGAFLQRVYVARNASRNAGGVLRYYAGDSTMTWQAAGDTEGARVKITQDHMWYTLPSGTAGAELYLETIPRLVPPTNASATFPAPLANLWRYENTSSFGLSGWIQVLSGAPYARTVSYAKSSATLADMRAAHADWETDYTDVTHIYMGTNDVGSRALALRALEDLEFIVRSRQAIGSKVIAGCILPVTGRSAEALQAVAEFNLGLRAMGDRLGFGVWDAWPYVAQANGDWVAGYSYDGTHMTPATCYLVAKRAVLPVLQSVMRAPMPTVPVMAAFDAVLAPYGNLIPNAVMTGSVAATSNGTGATGNVPTNWAVTRSSGSTITAVCTPPDDAAAPALPNGRVGKYFRVVINNNNASNVAGESMLIRRANTPTITGAVAGDLVVLEGEIRIQATGLRSLTVSLVESAAAGATTSFVLQGTGDASGLGSLDGDTVTLPFRSKPLRVSDGVTNLQVNITVTMLAGGTATLDIAPTMNLHRVAAA